MSKETLTDRSIAYAIFDPQEDITAYELALALPWYKHGALTLEYAETIAPVAILRHFRWVYKLDDAPLVARIKKLRERTTGDENEDEE
jgi:hypothetical protein